MPTQQLLTRFRKSEDGVAAIEFAFVVGILVPILMLLGFQVVTYVNAVRKVELLATSISEMISQANPPAGSTTATVNYSDLHFSYDSGLVIFPYLMTDAQHKGIAWWQDISINYASVQFTKVTGTTCPTNGDQSPCYVANVVWTSTGTAGGNNRPCVTAQLPMNDAATTNKAYLPRSIYGPGSAVVVDVAFTFNPTFASNFISPLTITRSVYVRPRYAALVNFDTTNNDGIATKCPGY